MSYGAEGLVTPISLGTVVATDVDDSDELSYEFVSTPPLTVSLLGQMTSRLIAPQVRSPIMGQRLRALIRGL